MKKRIIGAIIASIVIAILMTSFLIYKTIGIFGKIEQDNQNINIVKNVIESQDIIKTSSEDSVKVSPNTKIVFKEEFDKCGHVVENEVKNKENEVNKTKEELEENYPDWFIEVFSTEKVVLSKKENYYCDEHYVIKEDDGKVSIYHKEKDGKNSLNKITEIPVEYLPEIDKKNLEKGIDVIGIENVNAILEDLE